MNKELCEIIENKKIDKIFILCGENSFKTTNAKEYFSNIFLNKKVQIFYKKSFLPQFDELKEISKNLRIFNPDLFIAIGGGCVLDYAKIANIIDIEDKSEEFIKKYEHPIQKKFTKLIAIPTTAGSGAEVTSNAVIYIDQIKYSVEHDNLIPDYFFLIPEFILSVPKKIKSSAGFDAYAQAVESLLSMKSDEASIRFAVEGLKKIKISLIDYYENPNLNNSLILAQGANFAGKAIAISKTTLPHAVSYPFSSHYNLGHGHAVSLFFENFIKFNFDNKSKSNSKFDLNERFKILFQTLNVKDINDFFWSTINLKKKIGLEDDLNKLGVNILNDKDKILSGINFLRLGNNPVKISPEEIFNIIKK